MKPFFFIVATLIVAACNDAPGSIDLPDDIETGEEGISAEKEPWSQTTKASDDIAFAKDLPWKEGEKVLLLDSSQSCEGCTVTWEEGSMVTHPSKKTLCTVTKASGLKCTLTPDTPLEEGTYRAIYPVYDYVWYDYIHLSFLYEGWKELDCRHQDVVISDPVEYKDGDKLSFIMKHICALANIDIYPPKTGDFKFLKIFAETAVFPGKAECWIDKECDVNEFASGWLNYTTLRCDGKYMQAGGVFHTMTGLLPIKYNDMPMTIHVVYRDGTHYVSAPFPMPSLNLGVESTIGVKEFHQTDEPLSGKFGDYYGDPSGKPHTVE